MLLEFGLRNYFSFKEGARISFKLDANCPTDVSRGKSFTPVLCLKGANASGKSNILQALSFIHLFAARSFQLKPGAILPLQPHFRSTKPTELYIEFSIDDLVYSYELSVTRKEVISEVLYRTKAKRTKIVERNKEEIVFATKEFSRLRSMKLRANASLISTAAQYGFDELDAVQAYFENFQSNVTFGGFDEELIDIDEVAKYLYNNAPIFTFVKEFIKECDAGISDIGIVEHEDADGSKQYLPYFAHGSDPSRFVTAHTESSGTKALFRTLGRYKVALETGGVLVADEFDMHLHPHIVPKLLELFLGEESNKNNAQLVFSTHGAEVLNYLGRYRTYLVNKEDNESFAYRLDELPGDILRNDRPILPAYNDGKIGGIPKI